jgi:hypothetical protein
VLSAVFARLSSQALADFSQEWDSVGPPPTLTMAYLYAACSVVSLVAAIGFLLKRRWARWWLFALGPGLIVAARLIPFSVRGFFLWSWWSAGMPLWVLLAFMSFEVYAFRMALSFRHREPAA